MLSSFALSPLRHNKNLHHDVERSLHRSQEKTDSDSLMSRKSISVEAD
jgi:hypothetical protein